MISAFISDLHLESTESRTYHAFVSWLQFAVTRFDSIYILGDLVEVWIGDDDDAELAESLRSTLSSASSECSVYLMHGNRDFLYGERFAQETGVTLLDDPSVIDVDDQKMMVAHGDAYCIGDIPYQQMRSLVRSKDWQQEILAQPLAARRELARSLRQQSKDATQTKSLEIMDVESTAVLQDMTNHACKQLVHGHTHRPGKHIYTDGYTRYVLGDWQDTGWYASATAEGVTLNCFRIS